MAGNSDCINFKEVLIGSLQSRNITNAEDVVAKTFQHEADFVLGSATTAGSDYVWPVNRFNKAQKVIEARILPGAALTTDVANYVTIFYGYTNDNTTTNIATLVNANVTNGLNGTFQLGFVNTANVAAGGTGSWVLGTSLKINPLPASANVNVVIPANTQIVVGSLHNGAAGIAIPANTVVQLILEDV